MSEYIFPGRWCLKINDENRDIINDWRINVIKYDFDKVPEEYLYIVSYGGGSRLYENEGFPEYCTLITTEQFKEHVLGIITPQIIENEDYSYLIKIFRKLNIK